MLTTPKHTITIDRSNITLTQRELLRDFFEKKFKNRTRKKFKKGIVYQFTRIEFILESGVIVQKEIPCEITFLKDITVTRIDPSEVSAEEACEKIQKKNKEQ